VRNIIYRVYERSLERGLVPQDLPRHVGVILDGNRRWAERKGSASVSHGHAVGAQKTLEFLGWCQELGIGVVTLYLLSTDNLKGRASTELEELQAIIGQLANDIAQTGKYRVKLVGDREALPSALAEAIQTAESATASFEGMHVNLAVAYGGRKEIADAMRSILKQHAKEGTSIDDLAELLDPDLITQHLYTSGQPDPDLVIRTSGEQRLSGFLLWQSAQSEFYFEEALWPDFRRVDFLRAIRAFESRHRRFGK
jgi:short-chain Z-isoprenyl diphosphate synthase